jgi:hypothetical protein
LICRTEKSISDEIKNKLALFCNVKAEHVIEEKDVDFSIYEVPIMLVGQKLDEFVIKHLCLKCADRNMVKWYEMVNKLKHADEIIKYKLDSFGPIRDSGIWIKENSLPTDIILSSSVPETTYYTERKVLGVPPGNLFENITKTYKPRYLILSLFDVSSKESYDYPTKYNETLMPVKAYYLDAAQTQPSLIIYKFNY